ncbi:MAG TPA: glycosyltransferase [Pyrinomonadaceae bacterium]|jgi:cellulose synthase/poly-beta-1,6-N-acetylglucosamine synthase-like glycosyltransferase|nr:glycosyltransferase [Pyrinomonadaceae bacterium]
MFLFYFFAVVLIWQGLASLRGGVQFLSYVRGEMSKGANLYAPFASVIAPCRGLDQGLKENIAALFRQDYPAYEIIFVTDSADDPSLAIIEETRQAMLDVGTTQRARVVIAGQATESGQKVHNLLAAVRAVRVSSEVLVFVDSDARPPGDWLRSLVAPLADKRIGAATGYRWFIPPRGGLASHLRSVWNASIASALGPNVEKNFCWGGSTAIRRETFARMDMMEKWRGTLSDDFALMRALRAEKLPIHFVPACLVASLEDCDFRELLEFTTRQLKITRVYAPHFWKAVLLGSILFTTGFFGGIALVVARAALGLTITLPLILLLLIFLLGAGKSFLRLRAVSLPLALYRRELRNSAPAHLLLWPLTVLIYLYNALAAACSRRIEWRGMTYELKSPTETVIIERVHAQGNFGPEKIRRAQ